MKYLEKLRTVNGFFCKEVFTKVDEVNSEYKIRIKMNFKIGAHNLLFTLLLIVSCAHVSNETTDPSNKFSNLPLKNPKNDWGINSESIEMQADQALNSGDDAINYMVTEFTLKANDLSMRGESVEAIFYYKQLLKLKPKDKAIKKKYVLELIKKGEIKEAQLILSELFVESKNHIFQMKSDDVKITEAKKENESILVLLAGVYSAMEKHSEALELYNYALEFNDEIEEACLYLVKDKLHKKKIAEGIQLLNKCEQKHPNNGIFSFYRGRIMIEIGNKKKAVEEFKHSIKVDSDFYQSAIMLATLYEDMGKTAEAVDVYKNFLAADENDDQLVVLSRLVSLLFSHEKEDRYSRDLLFYGRELAAIDPADLNLKVRMGIFLSERGLHREAIDLFEDVAKLAENSDKINFYLAALYREVGERKKSKENFLKIAKESPLYKDASIQLGEIYLELAIASKNEIEGSSGKAVDDFFMYSNESAQHFKGEMNELSFRMMQAAFYEDKKDFAAAIKIVGDLKNHQHYTDAHHYYLASLYEKKGDLETGMNIAKEILARDNKNANAHNFIGYSLLMRNLNLPEAYQHIKMAVALKPNDGFIRDSMAWYYYSIGKYHDALKEAKIAVKFVNADVLVLRHLAMIYVKLNHRDEADKILTSILNSPQLIGSEREDVLKLISSIKIEKGNGRAPASLSSDK